MYQLNNYYLKAETFQTVNMGKSCFNTTLFLNNTGEIKYSKVLKFYSTKKSWNEASVICKNVGGHLPYFSRREQLQELIS